MTSEGKSARELLQELITRWHEIAREVEAVGGPEIPKHVRMREGGRINSLLAELETFLTAIERESLLSIAAALEMAAKLSCDRYWVLATQLRDAILALTPESVAQARAEHDREVQMELLRKLLSEVSDPLFGKYGYRKDVANLIDAHIRALASTTEAQAGSEDSGPHDEGKWQHGLREFDELVDRTIKREGERK